MSIVGEVPQAFIVHRENPRHPQHKNLSLLKKNSACKGWNDHLVACFIFRWRRRRRGWVAQFGAAMWSGLKYNSYTQPGERAILPYGSSLHSHSSFWGLTFPGNIYGTFNVRWYRSFHTWIKLTLVYWPIGKAMQNLTSPTIPSLKWCTNNCLGLGV